MSWPVWPEGLNKFDRPGWQVQVQEARQRRQSEFGPPGWKRRFSSVARYVSLSLTLSRDERAVFDRFYEEDCAQGSLPFYMPDPATHGWQLLATGGQQLLDGSGAPLLLAETWLCSWGEVPPAETITGQVDFLKTFQVVVLP